MISIIDHHKQYRVIPLYKATYHLISNCSSITVQLVLRLTEEGYRCLHHRHGLDPLATDQGIKSDTLIHVHSIQSFKALRMQLAHQAELDHFCLQCEHSR